MPPALVPLCRRPCLPSRPPPDATPSSTSPSHLQQAIEIFSNSTFQQEITHFTADFSIEIDAEVKYQKLIGIGGAFTDAAGINIKNLPRAAQDALLQSYFSDRGLRYNIGRIPIASCDFSTRVYSYDDFPGDFQLRNFSLAREDFEYKIPLIKRARELTNGKLRLFGSPWASPGWMKTNGHMQGNGTIIGKPGGRYYKTWANYFVKFLDAYAAENVSIWGLTTQNEPRTGFKANYSFQTIGFTPEMQRDFVSLDLGPALNASRYRNVKLMIMDDQRNNLPHWADVVLRNPDNYKYVSGVAVHWYHDDFSFPSLLDLTHQRWPHHFIFYSEASVTAESRPVRLGFWKRARRYASDIIQNFNHFATGWTDWNLALNLGGGPNWVSNFVDSPIIVNASAGEFYKQPMFYAIGHFSRFLPRGSVRISSRITPSFCHCSVTAFLTPSEERVLIFLNEYHSTNLES